MHDLVYLDEVPNRVGELKLLNIEKRYQLFNVIKNLAGNQDGYYHLRPIPLMQQMLLTVRTMDDKQSYARSLEVEPRGFNPSSSPFIGRRRGTIVRLCLMRPEKDERPERREGEERQRKKERERERDARDARDTRETIRDEARETLVVGKHVTFFTSPFTQFT